MHKAATFATATVEPFEVMQKDGIHLDRFDCIYAFSFVSKYTIMLTYFYSKRHPETNSRLLKFDNFLILLPMVFAGNMCGYFLYVTFPKMLINILFGLTLCFFTFIVGKE